MTANRTSTPMIQPSELESDPLDRRTASVHQKLNKGQLLNIVLYLHISFTFTFITLHHKLNLLQEQIAISYQNYKMNCW